MRPASGEREQVVAILSSLPIGVMLFDGLRMTYANPAARGLLDQIVDNAQVDEIGNDALAAAVTETSESGAPLRLDISHGDRRLALRTTLAGEGSVVAALTDVTEARRVDDLRRDFVTNASHELKTPVAGIQALSESLELAIHRSPERAHAMVQRLQIEAQRLNQLVRELLDLARLEDSSEVPAERRQRVDLAEIAHAQAERLADRAAELGVSISVVAPEPAVIIGSPSDVRLIVANLLDNAVEYNRPGGSVNVTVSRSEGTVTVVVSDTGIGIPSDQLDRVLERFYRVDKARSRLAGGTGLGLSITRHAVELHHGRLTIESELGVGSQFRVELPVAPD